MHAALSGSTYSGVTSRHTLSLPGLPLGRLRIAPGPGDAQTNPQRVPVVRGLARESLAHAAAGRAEQLASHPSLQRAGELGPRLRSVGGIARMAPDERDHRCSGPPVRLKHKGHTLILRVPGVGSVPRTLCRHLAPTSAAVC